jgi:hypothetical protein
MRAGLCAVSRYPRRVRETAQRIRANGAGRFLCDEKHFAHTRLLAAGETAHRISAESAQINFVTTTGEVGSGDDPLIAAESESTENAPNAAAEAAGADAPAR